MITGSFTALITPFNGDEVDFEGLERLVDFQISGGITGILAVGTTGESPTLKWDEHIRVIEKIASKSKNNCLCIAGTGSNNTEESLSATKHAAECGVQAVLLVDPYYNGPVPLKFEGSMLNLWHGLFRIWRSSLTLFPDEQGLNCFRKTWPFFPKPFPT